VRLKSAGSRRLSAIRIGEATPCRLIGGVAYLVGRKAQPTFKCLMFAGRGVRSLPIRGVAMWLLFAGHRQDCCAQPLVISHLSLIKLTQLVGGAIGEVDGEVIAAVRCLCMAPSRGWSDRQFSAYTTARRDLRWNVSPFRSAQMLPSANFRRSSRLACLVLGWQRSAPTPRNRRRNQEATRRTVRRYEAPYNRVVSRHPLLDKLDC
jgi:hypothetical protein